MNMSLQPGARGAARDLRSRVTRVLIIDGHDLVRRGLAALLNAQPDMQCCGEAGVDEQAFGLVASCRPDVVVIDVSAMRGAGLVLVQRIRKHDASIRIVALAMTEWPELVERSLTAGAVAFVSKNGLADRVLEAVRRHQPGRTKLPEAGRGDWPMERRGRSAGVLDPIEREIMCLIGRGMPTPEIAVRLGLSVVRVEGYRRRVRAKLNCPTGTQLVEFCARLAARDGTEEGPRAPLFSISEDMDGSRPGVAS